MPSADQPISTQDASSARIDHVNLEGLVAIDKAHCQVSTAPVHATNLEQGKVSAVSSTENPAGV